MDTSKLNPSRAITLTAAQLAAHSESIKHWLIGGTVEEYYPPDWITVCNTPTFCIEQSFRPLVRQPKVGEVWCDEQHAPFIAAPDFIFVSLTNSSIIGSIIDQYPDDLTYAATTPSAYFHQIHSTNQHSTLSTLQKKSSE